MAHLKIKAGEGTSGVTLLELLIVMITLMVVLLVIIPPYFRVMERAFFAEAEMVLGRIRRLENRYYAENGRYATSLDDFDSSLLATTGVPRFTYAVAGVSPSGFIAVATRNALDFTRWAGCASGYTIRLNEAGVFAGKDCQSTRTAVP